MTPGIAYSGAFYGQDGKGTPVPEAITEEALIGIIEALPAGVTELGCDPGLDGDLETTYLGERRLEVASVCAPVSAPRSSEVASPSAHSPACRVSGGR